MIADALRVEIERYGARMRSTSPLFARAEAGTLDSRHILLYLASVRYLVSFTPAHLDRARERALACGDRALAAHFAHKALEEIGHDRWAEDDIAKVGGPSDRLAAPLPEMRDYVAFISSTIDLDPACYLAYILFAEYFVVLLGPQWLTLLEERCAIPKASMSFLANHAELDREHTEEALGLIDQLVADPRKLAPMRRTVLDSITHFERFVNAIVREGDCRNGLAPAA